MYVMMFWLQEGREEVKGTYTSKTFDIDELFHDVFDQPELNLTLYFILRITGHFVSYLNSYFLLLLYLLFSTLCLGLTMFAKFMLHFIFNWFRFN